jgi:hypothetical protein
VVFAVLSRPAARAALLLTPRAGSAGSTGTPTKRKVIARRTSREHTRRVLGGQGPQPGSGGHNRAKVSAAPPSRRRKDMAPRGRGPGFGDDRNAVEPAIARRRACGSWLRLAPASVSRAQAGRRETGWGAAAGGETECFLTSR